MTQLILLRHGQPELTESLLGRTDSALSTSGLQQVNVSAKSLPLVDRVISSPMKRCLSFASKYATNNSYDLVIDSTWQECDFGDWDGIKYAELAQKFSTKFSNFINNPAVNTPPNGEGLADFYLRVKLGVEQLLLKYPGEKILLVTHSGVIRSLLAWCLKIDFIGQPDQATVPFQRIKIDYASITQIDIWNEDSLLPQIVSLNHTPWSQV